jgi:inosine-uridine nucleoside N-ribohydrolase
MVQLVTWELTLAHGCPWEWVEKEWFGQATEKSAFLRRISGFTQAAMKASPSAAHGFLIPDPLAVAVALKPEIVSASALSHVTVELAGVHTRGMVVHDWFNSDHARDAEHTNCRVITAVDQGALQEMLLSSVCE